MEQIILLFTVFVIVLLGVLIWKEFTMTDKLDDFITDMENLNRISKQYKWNEKMSKEDREFLEEFVKK